MMETGASLESHLIESVRGVTTIRRFGLQDLFKRETENKFKLLMKAIFSGTRNRLILSNTLEWFSGILTISFLWSGSYLVIERHLSPGELISLFTLMTFFTGPVQYLIGVNHTLQDALIAADRLFEIIDLETESNHEQENNQVSFQSGDLVFENIQFSYRLGQSVFSGLQFRIRQNQVTAIVGESGSGKSTLLALIQKIYALNEGNILIGETDIRNISTEELRKKIVAVPQQTDLFLGDFISNIAFGDPDPDLGRIKEICQRLGLHEYISQLPENYLTVLREQGANLSGGQKQRLGIARAMYRNPEILILDEATSAIDPEGENKVREAIRWFFSFQKTIIIITHRISTLRFCDEVVLIKQGKCVAIGKHENLLTKNEQYAAWWKWHQL